MKLPRHAELWLPGYVGNRLGRFVDRKRRPIERVWLVVADHYEPFWNRVPFEKARERVVLWREGWTKIAHSGITDSAGNPPRYTFFYPQEEYQPELLETLAGMVRGGIADVEVHIHHDREGRDTYVQNMSSFCQTLSREHGLLRKVDGQIKFGFIHGNWALDNSLPGGKWCGLNDEITILRDLGCYADFTMPSGNSHSQARTVNTIYWCTDDPNAPKSYDTGIPVRAGAGRKGDLLMIPGPFGVRWRGRLLPQMETGELAGNDLPTAYRVKRWFELAPRIMGDLFIKLYTHGTQERNSVPLLGGGLKDAFALVAAEAKRRGAEIRFVSAWEMYRAIQGFGKKDEVREHSQSGTFSRNERELGASSGRE